MKKSLTILALAFALAGTLTACSNRDPNTTTGGSASGSGASAGQVSRRYNTTMNQGRDYFYGRQPPAFSWSALADGRYTAGSNGQVYSRDDSTVSRDLTRDAREIVRDAGDAVGDVGRSIGNAARDITGTNVNPGTPSWEPDSSAARY